VAEKIENALTRYLDEQGVAYEVVAHGERFTAAAEARASGTEPEDATKEVMLRRDDGYVLAVIPASERLDPRKAAKLLGESGELRLASEEEMGADFAQFELGALPPFGPILEVEQIVDQQLLDHGQVLCSAGDHRHSVKLDPKEMVQLTEARVGDLVED